MTARILILDDDPALQEILGLFLSDEGYTVLARATPVADLREVQQVHPDLLLLDYVLSTARPGPPLWERLAHDPALAAIPLLLCTAALDRVRPQEGAFQAAGIGVLYKPFDLEDLLQAVRARLPAP